MFINDFSLISRGFESLIFKLHQKSNIYYHIAGYIYINTHIIIDTHSSSPSSPSHPHGWTGLVEPSSHHPITGHEPRIRLHWARAQWPEICRMGAESVTGCTPLFYPIFEFQMCQNLWKLPYIAMIILRMPCRICKISGTSCNNARS